MHPWHYLTLTALVGIAGCTPFQSSAQNTTVDKTEWVTHCFGRFLIDLPQQAKINAGYQIWRPSVKRINETPTSLTNKIKHREQELISLPHSLKGSLFIRRVEHGNGSVTLLHWDSNLTNSTKYVSKETYLVAHGDWRAYEYFGELSADKQISSLAVSEKIAKNLHSLQHREIPSDPGFCIDGAYIAGSTFQREGFNVGVTFPNHPGAFFSFSTDTGAEEDQLLDRVGGFLAGAAKMVAGLETLRKGQRNIGPISAQEYLVAGSAEGQRAYSFAWESQGKDGSLSEPNITAGLGVLERDADSHGNPPPPAFRSDQEALELWDAIIDSIRLRPGAAGPSSAQNGVPDTGQHSLRATSGTPCPWPGLWTCNEAPQLGAQTIAHGVPMPSVEGNAVTWRLLRGI
ncbi:MULTISPECIES: T6SS immunity protein Tli4 family protein [Pseudomonas]|nr:MULTISPECIES: T6SS immunity protein Tli4 family protein [Pseudomonas]WBG62302.1 hypothetical protein ELR50_05175 [Pseudomonas citronellolis]